MTSRLFVKLAVSLAVITLSTPAARAVPVVAHAAKDPNEAGTPVRLRPGGATVQRIPVKLTAKEVVGELAPGKPFWFWTWEGTVPGPIVRGMEGDTLDLTVCNDPANLEPHNVDFHAVLGPGGGAAVTGVQVGQCKSASFKLTQAGAYIYHCAAEGMPWEHVSHGMYGLIVVEPKGGLPPVDKEFYVGQSDWYLTDTLTTRADIGAAFHDVDLAKASNEFPVSMYTFNGHTQALGGIYPLEVMQDQKVRFFFVTGGPNVTSNWHIIGAIFDRVYKGDPSKQYREKSEETIAVPPGSAAVFELTAAVPGDYLIVDHALFRVPKGAGGKLHVNGRPSPTCDPITGAVIAPGSWPMPIYSPATCGSGH
jgi:nitrite reductase (NO-forming)